MSNSVDLRNELIERTGERDAARELFLIVEEQNEAALRIWRVHEKNTPLLLRCECVGCEMARLLADGYEVRVLDNFATGRRSNLAAIGGDVELVEGDIAAVDVACLNQLGREGLVHAHGAGGLAAKHRLW